MRHTLRTLALPTALAGTLVLAACGTPHTSGTTGTNPSASAANGAPASKTKNEADVEFATMMIPHHTQAIEMADLALKQATNSKVKALAPKIKAAQDPEIQRMSGWLTGWGEPVPATAGGHDMPDMGEQTGGMMSAQEMTDLGKATGSAFDRMWLQMMVRHHQGAVAVAKTELAKGTNPESKQLAQSIIDSQSAEIAAMSSILAGAALSSGLLPDPTPWGSVEIPAEPRASNTPVLRSAPRFGTRCRGRTRPGVRRGNCPPPTVQNSD